MCARSSGGNAESVALALGRQHDRGDGRRSTVTFIRRSRADERTGALSPLAALHDKWLF